MAISPSLTTTEYISFIYLLYLLHIVPPFTYFLLFKLSITLIVVILLFHFMYIFTFHSVCLIIDLNYQCTVSFQFAREIGFSYIFAGSHFPFFMYVLSSH